MRSQPARAVVQWVDGARPENADEVLYARSRGSAAGGGGEPFIGCARSSRRNGTPRTGRGPGLGCGGPSGLYVGRLGGHKAAFDEVGAAHPVDSEDASAAGSRSELDVGSRCTTPERWHSRLPSRGLGGSGRVVRAWTLGGRFGPSGRSRIRCPAVARTGRALPHSHRGSAGAEQVGEPGGRRGLGATNQFKV